MTVLSYEQLALIAERQRSELLIDPLVHHRWSSNQARDMVHALNNKMEVHVRAGNRAGKTTNAAAYFTALSRGIRELDARTIEEQRAGAPRDVILLPAVKTPTIGLLGVSSLKQSSESAVAAYRKVIGHHDHRFLKGAQGSVVDIRIRPDRERSDDPDKWSRIMVFPVEGTPPTGIGATWCHADETPTETLWTQMRMRVTAGQDLYLCITQTPEKRDLWEWLRADYKHPDPWKLEILLSVFDNQALTASEKSKIRARAGRDPLELARLYGNYVDLTGTNPWKPQVKLLQRWLENCRNPIREETVMMPVEIETETGLKVEDGHGEVFIWEDPIPGERYYVTGDPSQGYGDGDYGGFHVSRRGFRTTKPGQVVRYNGMCGGYALGHLMAQFGERYNDGLADPDVTGGYGQAVLRGLADYRSARHSNGYPNVNHERRIDTSGKPYSKRLGTVVTAGVKHDMVEAIRWALLTDGFEFPSAATVRCMMETVTDGNGKFLKPPGVAYEDFHCGARACQLIMDRNQTESGSKREHALEDLFKREGIRLGVLPSRRKPTPGSLSRFQWRRG